MSFGSTILSLITGALLLFGAVTWWKETKVSKQGAVKPNLPKTSARMSYTDHSWCNAAQCGHDGRCNWDPLFSDCYCDDGLVYDSTHCPATQRPLTPAPATRRAHVLESPATDCETKAKHYYDWYKSQGDSTEEIYRNVNSNLMVSHGCFGVIRLVGAGENSEIQWKRPSYST
eukprot:246445_1